jgi:hypothetical protein
MASKRRLSVRVSRNPAMMVTRTSVGRKRLCYVIVASKKLRYKTGWSSIAYIGTTKKGVKRVAASAAYRAPEVLALHGVRSFTVRIVSCQSRQRVRTWATLERALLLAFKELYGQVPQCNTVGKRMKPSDEFEYFRKSRLMRVLEDLG